MEIAELQEIDRQACVAVAEKLGIQDYGSLTVEQFRDRLKAEDPVVSERFEAFSNEYYSWNDLDRRFRAADRQGKLSRDEEQQLARLVGRRNETREALIASLP